MPHATEGVHSGGAESCTPTRRECEVLRAIARYGTVKAVAEALNIARYTADGHVDGLRDKCGLRHLPQLVAWAMENGWLGKVFEDDAPPVEKQPNSGIR